MTKEKKKIEILNTSLWRILAYFTIYSFLGYVIETLFAIVTYGIWESRQSFLYGPFCSIYGVGAVVIILILKNKFSKNTHTLFLGGFLVGSVVEYIVSLVGEVLLGVKWWDYSDRFLNINGRVCLLYSLFWGILGLYLLKEVNPRVDKFIDWFKGKVNVNALKSISMALTIFLLADCILSAFAINFFLIRISYENNLDVKNKTQLEEYYDKIYKESPKLSKFIYDFWGDYKMIRTYPNLTVELEDDTLVYVKNYLPDIQSYYYKFHLKEGIIEK